jgi:hypothetical protein
MAVMLIQMSSGFQALGFGWAAALYQTSCKVGLDLDGPVCDYVSGDGETKLADISSKRCFSLSKSLPICSFNLWLSSMSFFNSALTAWDSSLSSRDRAIA